jgi:predicted aspartyl protease
MQKLAVVGAIFLILFQVPCIAKPAVGDATTEVPFSFEKGFVIVKARIKGNVDVDVVISTGAQYSTVDKEVLDKYKLFNFRGAPVLVTDIYFPIREFVSVPDLRVGEARTPSLEMGLVSTSAISKLVGREIFGTLGANFFKDRVVQFDFRKKVLRFIDPSSSDVLDTQKVGTVVGGRILLRMIPQEDPIREKSCLPILENVIFNGKESKLLLDTGTVAVVALSSSAAKKLGFTVPPEKSAPRADRIESLSFGAYELKSVPVMIYGKGTGMDQSLGEYGTIAGSLFLQNFIVTFNFRSKTVTLEHV